MDENPKSYARKQRQKHQRYRQKPNDKPVETASSNTAVDNNSSDPQPQRANRRQRNEAVTSPVSSVGDTTPPTSKDSKDTTEKENVTIDFSNLKRETEEIEKLTKKFAKRNISSNWHRYSAPEDAEDEEKTEEEAPADFSALIQMPASRGGHLQLKEEQEWSSASGEQLGGYFALNLKLLSQSLACIPLYEQLQLPKHMLTAEELKHFDNFASQAKKAYNPDTFEDPNTKIITNLLQRGTDLVEEPEPVETVNADTVFNILDLQASNNKLMNIGSEPEEVILEKSSVNGSNLHKNNKDSSEVFKSSYHQINSDNVNVIQPSGNNCSGNPILEGITTQKDVNISDHLIDNKILEAKKPDNKTLKAGKTNLTEEKFSPLSKASNEIVEEQPVSLTCTAHKVTEVDKIVEKSKLSNENSDMRNKNSVHTSKEILQENNYHPETIVKSEPKDKLSKNNRKTLIKEVNENKPSSRENSLKLEDDDDLDFLLSLKKPIVPEIKKTSKSVPDKDTASLSGHGTSQQASSTQQHSELDDWLDSVLQD